MDEARAARGVTDGLSSPDWGVGESFSVATRSRNLPGSDYQQWRGRVKQISEVGDVSRPTARNATFHKSRDAGPVSSIAFFGSKKPRWPPTHFSERCADACVLRAYPKTPAAR